MRGFPPRDRWKRLRVEGNILNQKKGKEEGRNRNACKKKKSFRGVFPMQVLKNVTIN